MISSDSSYFEFWWGHSAAGKGVAIPDAVNLTGSTAGTHYADGGYLSITAGSTAGNGATLASSNTGPAGSANTFSFAQDVDVTAVVRTGSSIANIRLWFAFVDSSTRMGNNDTFSGTANVIGFRFSSPAGDTYWTGFCQDGSSSGSNYSTVAVTTEAVGASTQYVLRLRTSGGTAYFSVNGGAESSISTHVPAANYCLMSVEVWTTSTGATHSLEIGRVGCTIG